MPKSRTGCACLPACPTRPTDDMIDAIEGLWSLREWRNEAERRLLRPIPAPPEEVFEIDFYVSGHDAERKVDELKQARN